MQGGPTWISPVRGTAIIRPGVMKTDRNCFLLRDRQPAHRCEHQREIDYDVESETQAHLYVETFGKLRRL